MRQTVVFNGKRMSYLTAGQGQPLVLIHAFPLGAEMWRPQLDAPPSGWSIIAPELRHFDPIHTDGDGIPPAATLDDYAGDLVDLLDKLGVEKAVIGGLSMGGYIAFALYRRAAHYFRGLVLADTRALADTEEGKAGRRKMLALIDEQGVGAVADQMLPKLVADPASPAAGQVRALIERNRPVAVAAAVNAMMARPDSTPLLRKITEPTLIVVGEADALTPPSESEKMHKELLRSKLVTIPGAGHLSNLEQPAAFNTALAQFLDSNF